MSKQINWESKMFNDSIMNHDFHNSSEINNEVITFGTAGMRELMGSGKSKINIFSIAAATRAYASLLGKNKKIAVFHDNRSNGEEYTNLVSSIMKEYGIKTIVYPGNDLAPTPLLSFVIKEMKLDGGVMITASHNTKEYNGYKIYDSSGAQLLPELTRKISKHMKENSWDLPEERIISEHEVPKSVINKYVKNISKLMIDKGDVSVAYSPLAGTGSLIMPMVFNETGTNFVISENQKNSDSEFKNIKSPNPENSLAYSEVIKTARKNKSDIAIVTDPDSDRAGFAVKHKKRYKYMTGNQIATLYLEYILANKKVKYNKNSFIVTSEVSTFQVDDIAKKYGIKVRRVPVGFKNIADEIKNDRKNFIFAFEESYGYLMNPDVSMDKDAFQAVASIISMANFYKNKGLDLYKVWENIQLEHTLHRTKQISVKTNANKYKTIGTSIKKSHLGKKIKEYIDYTNKGRKLIKIIFENNSWIVIRPSGTEPKVKVYIESTISKADQNMLVDNINKTDRKIDNIHMNVTVFEEQIAAIVKDSTEEFEDKKFSWKTVFKYSIFILILIGILWFVFTKVYSGTGSESFNLFEILINKINKWVWLLMIPISIFQVFIKSFILKTLLKAQGENVKTRHILISSIMSISISYVTPFTVGGDAIGYWFLRRKGVKGGPLMSSYISTTVFYQILIIVQTLIFVPIGMDLYKDIFSSNNVHSKAVFWLFISGLSWDIFATTMILSLTFMKRFQEWIVKNTVMILEWMPFVHLSDPVSTMANHQNNFYDMRKGIKTIISSPRTLFTLIFLELILTFVIPYFIILVSTGIVSDKYWFGKYMSMLIGADMSSSANAFSLTPGGTGTGEYLSIEINKFIYNPLNSNTNPTDTATAVDMASKIFAQWPMLLISAITIISVIFGENIKNNKRRRGYYVRTFSLLSLFVIIGLIIFGIYI